MTVAIDEENLVSHAGAASLSDLAGRGGGIEAMSGAMAGCGINWDSIVGGLTNDNRHTRWSGRPSPRCDGSRASPKDSNPPTASSSSASSTGEVTAHHCRAFRETS